MLAYMPAPWILSWESPQPFFRFLTKQKVDSGTWKRLKRHGHEKSESIPSGCKCGLCICCYFESWLVASGFKYCAVSVRNSSIPSLRWQSNLQFVGNARWFLVEFGWISPFPQSILSHTLWVMFPEIQIFLSLVGFARKKLTLIGYLHFLSLKCSLVSG